MKRILASLLLTGFLVAGWQTASLQADEDKPEAKPAEAAQASEAKPADEEEKEKEEIAAGHSYHGEVFNEGPRQKAYLMGGTGNVHFPVSTKNDQVQKFIDQGVGQLHGFWTLEAERSFRQAAAIEPQCAMAYWGAALANRSNAKRSRGFLDEAIERKSSVSDRESMYINALDAYLKADRSKSKQRNEAYAKALEDIALKYPDDLEAKAFLALQLYYNRTTGTHLAADALMQQIFAAEPLHPAHHFRIHLWDYRRAEKALSSAARCGAAAPSIAHMWHMPGHIYSRLKRYHDAVWQQEASARVDHAHMMRDRVLPDQIHNFAHNNEWLIRNLIYIGRVNDAVDLAKNMTELPRHPKYNTLSRRGSAYYGRLRLFEVLSKYERWDEMIALCQQPYLEPTDVAAEQVKRLGYLGAAYFQTGDVEQGAAQLTDIEKRLKERTAARDKAVAAAEEKAMKGEQDKKKIEQAKANARKPFTTDINNLTRARDALQGYQAVAAEDYKQGYDLLKKGRVDTLYLAQVRFLAGEQAQAVADVRRQASSRRNEVLPLATLAELLWKQEKKDEAKKTFAQLREISSAADLESPPLARLAPIARAAGHPTDWRLARAVPDDFGDRPELDSLGPFRWQPSPAPAWTLKDAEDKSNSLNRYRGKPLVVIFYLGYGCLHCVEQLHAFDPKAKEFEKAGISLVAIGSDDRESLNKALDNYQGDDFRIKLLSDAKLDVFKDYRAHDDFEDQPLHGTFIVDADGLVRWQDISYEPFMDPDFVLAEAQRLFAQARPGTAAKVADSGAGNAPAAD